MPKPKADEKATAEKEKQKKRLANRFGVAGVPGGGIMIHDPPKVPLTIDEAHVFASWIINTAREHAAFLETNDQVEKFMKGSDE